MQDTFLTVKQVADQLQVKPATVYRWAAEGRLPAIRIGTTLRFRATDLAALTPTPVA